MSKTTTYRFEVSSPDYGVIEHVAKFQEAVTVAQNWIERENMPVEIFDRMAQKHRYNLYSVTQCTGEAHKNAFIDYCGVCAPFWGIVVKPSKHIAAVALGSITSERKAEAVRENGKKGGRPKKIQE